MWLRLEVQRAGGWRPGAEAARRWQITALQVCDKGWSPINATAKKMGQKQYKDKDGGRPELECFVVGKVLG